MKKIFIKLTISFLFTVFNTGVVYASNKDILKIQVIDNKDDLATAKITNLDNNNEYYNTLKDMKLIGKKVKQSEDVVNIDWNKIKLGEAEATLSAPFSSKVKITNDIKSGHKFSAQGNYSNIISAMEELLQQQEDSTNKQARLGTNTNSSSDTTSSFQASFKPLSYDNLNNNKDSSSTTETGEEITVTDGCLPYVDYELNTIYIQQRVLRDGQELQSCHNSDVSFSLRKDYDACPDKEDSSTGAKEIYFQYYYIDARNGNDVRHDIGQCQIDETQSTGGNYQEVTTTDGCSPYVDYELNKVFIQQRVLKGSQVVQSCHNSDISFVLQKDYDVCPDKIDLNSLTNKVYFKYYYIDDRNGNNVASNVGDCQIDNVKSGPLTITKNYDNCTKFIDLSAMKIYDQYQEYYSDSDNNKILLNDCQKDYDKSFKLEENFNKCPIKHDFEKGYSVAQKEIGYVDSMGNYIKVYDCMEDEDYKYTHNVTSTTCSNVVTNNEVQIFTRKYITVDGIIEYISECTPAEDNVSISDEICSENPYTHDMVAKQSYINRTYYYINNSGKRVDISTCIKSGEPFPHLEDTSVCDHEDDDNTKQTTIYSKTFIEVNGSKEYIGECKQMSVKVPYTEIGYKWENEFSTSSTAISVGNSGDNVYIGSKEGVENTAKDPFGQTTIINKYDISTYSTTGKCDGWNSASYNGVAIDLNLSSRTSVVFNNYVENRASSDVCYWYCQYRVTYPTSKCGYTPSRICKTNIVYYQRCTDHKCPLTKVVKFPIYRRSDGSEFVDKSINKEVKYICGNSSVLNGTEVYYDN
ncbi:MAG: hypothetical protein PHY80_02655 [Rickettsiales bacterium]|nr:hypothetical protein [Rickettsiales bacterium]